MSYSITGPGSIDRRPDTFSLDYTFAHTFGPVALNDFSEGLYARIWRARVDNVTKTVYLCRNNPDNTGWEAEIVLFAFAGTAIIELDAAFDQAGRVFVCAERATGVAGASEVWAYYFSGLAGAYVFESMGAGRTPRCLLDDPFDTTNGDVLLFYMNNPVGMCFRYQRDRFGIEHVVALPSGTIPPTAKTYIEDLFKATDGRVHILYSLHDVEKGQYTLYHYETLLYRILGQDPAELVPSARIAGGELHIVLISATTEPDGFQASALIGPGGTLHEIIIAHTLYDKDGLQPSAMIAAGGTLRLGIPITHTLYDKDGFMASAAIGAGGTLYMALIAHTLYDKAGFMASAVIAAGGTLA